MTNECDNDLLQQVIENWKYIAQIVREPKNEDDYDKLTFLLDRLLDIVAGDESHELIGFVDVISYFITIYDQKYYGAQG